MKWGFNKRRLFWACIVIVTAGFLFTGYWWHRANFPVPLSFFNKTTNSPAVGWFMDKRAGWLRHRAIAHTRKLRLSGTRWKDLDSGAVADFGEDGVFRWIERPYPTIDLPAFELEVITTEVDRSIEERLVGAGFQIHSRRPGSFITWERNGSWTRYGKNISFEVPEGETLEGLFGFDGRSLVVHVEDGDKDFTLKFEQRLK